MIKIGGQFSGVGAFDAALNRLKIPFENVYQAEWDKYARQTYLANNEQPEYYVEDVNDTPIEEITEKHGSLDIVMFSPPCQAFSLAGKRQGKNDLKGRGILFFNSLEFIEKNKPRFFIFENVKGLLSDDGGNTFNEWLNFLGGKSINGSGVLFSFEGSVPYHIYYKVLNAKDFGVPQNRERIFIIGIKDDQDNNFIFPKEEFLEKRLKDVLESEVDDKYYLSEKMLAGFTLHKERHEQKETGFIFSPKTENDIANCLRASSALCPTDNTIIIGDLNKGGQRGVVYSCNSKIMSCLSATDYKQPKQILTNKVRKLTPVECFRLMDFPNSLVYNAKKAGVSDSQLYKQAGNSIVVSVLCRIIERLKL